MMKMIQAHINKNRCISIYYLLFFAQLFIQIFSTENIKKSLRILNSYSQITLIINGTGNQKILNDYKYMPYKILVNDEAQNTTDIIVYDLKNEINNVTLIWDHLFDDCASMFDSLNNIIEIDCSKFDSSEVTNMWSMFYHCENLKYINLKYMNTSKLNYMRAMFDGCYSLVSLDLSYFDTSQVTHMGWLFKKCYSLVSLDLGNFNTELVEDMRQIFLECYSLIYLNLISFKVKNDCIIDKSFDGISDDLIYCMNNDKNSPNFVSALEIHSKKNECGNMCFHESKKIIASKKTCIDNCMNDNVYKYEYNNICYKSCLNEDNLNDDDLCYEDLIKNKFYVNNNSDNNIIDIIKNKIENNEIDSLFIQENNKKYQLIPSDTEYNFQNNNISFINIGKCEDILRNEYNISNDVKLLIFKIDIYEEGLLIPIIEYEVYNSKTREKLNLTLCKSTKIEIFIPVQIEEDKLYKYDPNSKYYNDKCFPSTTDQKTDITLNDRRIEFNRNNMSLCESICEFNGYDRNSKKVKCKCDVKNQISDNMIIYKSFTEIKSMLNLDVIKCYHVLFTREGFIYNIGSYILLSIIFYYIISLIFFISKGFKNLSDKIKDFVRKIKNDANFPDENFKKNKKKRKRKKKFGTFSKNKSSKGLINAISKNEPPKNKKIFKKRNSNKKIKSIHFLNTDNSKSNAKIEPKLSATLSKRQNKKSKTHVLGLNSNFKSKKNILSNKNLPINYNDYEINSLSYKEALIIDKRNYFQYYFSLLRSKHLLIFTFYTSNDYNSTIIKICLFFFSFSLYYFVNALFFTDSTLHVIYEDLGIYNLIFQIPKILYSTCISSAIELIVTSLSLTQKNILELKKYKGNLAEKIKDILKCLIAKFTLFFIISFFFLIIFWYYLSCFCSVYKNTQIYLIKNSLISYCLSLLYPLLFYLIPGIFRIPSLRTSKKNMEAMYKFSKFIQLIY